MQSSLPIYFVIDIWKLDIPAATATFVQNTIVEPKKSDQDCSNQVHLITGNQAQCTFSFSKLDILCLCKRGIWGWTILKNSVISRFSMHCSKSLIEIRNNVFYRVRHGKLFFYLGLTDRNTQVRFCLKVVLQS